MSPVSTVGSMHREQIKIFHWAVQCTHIMMFFRHRVQLTVSVHCRIDWTHETLASHTLGKPYNYCIIKNPAILKIVFTFAALHIKLQYTFCFPRQVWFCPGWRAALCPLVFCDGGLRMEQCIGPLSSSCGPWGLRTPPCSLVPLLPSSQPPRTREPPHHSVSKREGKLVTKSLMS